MSALGPREHAEIRRFRAALTLDPGVSIHVVVADTRGVLDEALDEVGLECVIVRPLAPASVDAQEHAAAILRAFEEALEHAGGRPIVLEAIVSTPATDRAWRRVFAALNETRNFLEQRASGPLVFCVRPELESALGHEAPDVWSKRGSGMRLLDRTPNRVFVSWAADSPEVVAGVDDLARALTEAGLQVDRDGWPTQASADVLESFAQERLRRADVVVCVCTPLYRARVEVEVPVGCGSGATWEACAVRHDAYALGPRSDRFVLVELPSIGRAVPAALDTDRAIHQWPQDRARLIEAVSATTVHMRLQRTIERTFGDDTEAMDWWSAEFLTRWWPRESEPEPRELGDRLLRVRDLDSQRRALLLLRESLAERGAMDSIAAALGLGSLPDLRVDPTPLALLIINTAKYVDYLDSIVSRYRTDSRVASADDLLDPLDAFVRMSGSRRLHASAEVAVLAMEAEVKQHLVEHRSMPLPTAFEHARAAGRRGLVLLGDPGAGKSTRLVQLMLKMARDGAEAVGFEPGTIPILLDLRNLRPGVETLRSFVEKELGEHRHVARLDGLLVLFDGLDEVADPEQRRLVTRWIERRRRMSSDTYFLVSSRYGGYTPDLELDAAVVELHIRPLDDARARRFVTRWCANRQIAPEGTAALLEALSRWRADDPQLHSLTRSPLVLAMLCAAYFERGASLQRRTEIYEACVSVPLRGHPFATELRTVLEDIAWWMQTEERTRATAAELEPVVRSAFARVGLGLEPLPWLRSIRDEHGLLLGWGIDDYGFVHPAIQQHLAAQRMRAPGHQDPDR